MNHKQGNTSECLDRYSEERKYINFGLFDKLTRQTVPSNYTRFGGIIPLTLHRKLKRILLLPRGTRCQREKDVFSDRTVRRQNKFLGSAMLHHWRISEFLDENVRVIQE